MQSDAFVIKKKQFSSRLKKEKGLKGLNRLNQDISIIKISRKKKQICCLTIKV